MSDQEFDGPQGRTPVFADQESNDDATLVVGRDVPFKFHGTAGGYFGVWIVNLLLSMATFGLFSPWAKVRTNRYFYGNTFLDGQAFEYHAKGHQILIGRIIAVAFLGAYLFTASVYPLVADPIFLPILLIVAPYFVMRAMRFRTRMTSYRNVRLNFKGTARGALLPFTILPALAFGPYYVPVWLTQLGYPNPFADLFKLIDNDLLEVLVAVAPMVIFFPLIVFTANRYVLNNLRFGDRDFEARLAWPYYYVIYGIVVLIFAALGYIAFQALFEGGSPSPDFDIGMFLIIYFTFLFLLVGMPAFAQAMVTNHALGNTELDRRHGFRSTLSPWVFAWIAVSNLLAVVLSMGFAYPWTQVRIWRYRCQETVFDAGSDLSEFISDVEDTSTAIGDEMAEVFDFDIGI